MDGMEAKHVDIDEATLEELRWFASVVLQVELGGKENTNALRAKVRESWSKPTIFLPVKADHYPDNADSQGRGPGKPFETEWPPESGKTRQCLRISIPELDPTVYPGGDEPVPVSVNGKAMYIPRDVPQTIPVEYVEVLANAEKFVYPEYDPNKDGGRGGLQKPQIVKEYPFNYV